MLPLLLSHGNFQVLLSIGWLNFCAMVLACKKHLKRNSALMSRAVFPLQPAQQSAIEAAQFMLRRAHSYNSSAELEAG